MEYENPIVFMLTSTKKQWKKTSKILQLFTSQIRLPSLIFSHIQWTILKYTPTRREFLKTNAPSIPAKRHRLYVRYLFRKNGWRVWYRLTNTPRFCRRTAFCPTITIDLWEQITQFRGWNLTTEIKTNFENEERCLTYESISRVQEYDNCRLML